MPSEFASWEIQRTNQTRLILTALDFPTAIVIHTTLQSTGEITFMSEQEYRVAARTWSYPSTNAKNHDTDMRQSLTNILIAITDVLRKGDDTVRLRQFEELCRRAKNAKSADDQRSLARTILRTYGGMGSFNDAIVYQNDVIDKPATNQLDSLRGDLFEAARNLL